ncbi:UvrD-helicase domain-containing protein [Aestuariimicrobium kwangyangense]|uniref:HelD family protein n=1 Tax=Aestuariimicrobium kwangyangense TaxID=396389 RepID=UPI00059150BF
MAAEQDHVDRVYQALDLATASAKQVARAGSETYKSDRGDYVREEHGTAMFERDAFAYQSARRLATLDAEHEGLVFGRLDLTDGEVRHIGRIGVRDEEYEPLVMDWRAPAAEPFYRATPNEPLGVIRRRVLRTHGATVTGVEDDLLDSSADSDLVVVGEGALMAALKRARGDAMRDIVATIQAEQDEAIRAPYQGFTVISGGPGTGKTVVALHRAAYLLYTHRKRLEKGGVLVVGPSGVFMNYIERVLPSLGEDAVTLRAVGALAVDVLGSSSDIVDTAPAALLKGSIRMLPVLRALAQLPPGDQEPSLRVSVKGEVMTLRPQQVAGLRKQVLSNHRLNQGREAAERAALGALWGMFTNDDELGRDQFDDAVTSQASWTMFLHAWWPSVDPRDLLTRLVDPAVLEQVGGGLSAEERRVLAESYAPVVSGERGWTIADIALLDELVSIVGAPVVEVDDDRSVIFEGGADVEELVTTMERLTDQRVVDPDDDPQDTFAHVLVDEAQDITPMQWRMLRRRGPQASWTIVGDPAQSSFPDPDETARAMTDLVGRAPFRQFRLSTNYRSPAEVFNLAAKVITTVQPDADLPEAVRRTGFAPQLEATTPEGLDDALRQHVSRLADQVTGTIGVVSPPSLIERVRAALATSHPDRVRVVTPLQAKGLEYDGVLVVSPDDVVAEAPGGVRVLYVALTRPTQRLVTLDLDRGRPARWRPEVAGV